MKVFQARIVNLIIAIVNLFLMIFHPGAIQLENKQIDLSGMALVFDEEFDGDQLNTARRAQRRLLDA